LFDTMKQLFKPTNKDLRKRILFTIFALAIFKIGTGIRVPGTESIVSDLAATELFNAFAGGGFKNFSIFALGVMPYITASILVSLLQMDLVPYLAELKHDGYAGRQKINQITRYIGIAFAFIQGYLMAYAFIGTDANPIQYMETSIILTAGTAFLLWLGDQITQKGIGNGISLIIMAGIISTMPVMFVDAFNTLVTANGNLFIGIMSFSVFVLFYLAIIVGVIFIQQAERRVPIQYANKTMSAYGGKQTYIPFRLNSAGVIPVIFASAVMTIPATLSQFIKNENVDLFITKYLGYDTTVGFIIFVTLIFVLSYFYTIMTINPKELGEDLQKSGGYIPGIRPGTETNTYIKKMLTRITTIGALFLVAIAGIPIIVSNFTSLPSNVRVGGTGLLIVVGVALETYKQIESSLVSRNYKGGFKS